MRCGAPSSTTSERFGRAVVKAVTLFIPGLSRLDGPELRDQSAGWPGLARLLGRAAYRQRETPPEAALLEACGLPPDFAWARLTARLDLSPEAAAEDLLRCDPVYLHADPNKVLLYAAPALEAEEASALLDSLKHDFPELGLRCGIQPSRWYIRRPTDIDGQAPSVHWLNGRSLSPHLPQSRAHRSWRQLLNEIQMALHDHPVNEDRAARGLPPVNGVWICGGGVLSTESRSTDVAPVTSCVGNDVLLAGIADARGIPWRAMLPTPLTAIEVMGPRVLMLAGPGFGSVGDHAGISLTEVESILLREFPPSFNRAWQVQGATGSWTSGWPAGYAFWRPPAHFAVDTAST